MFQHDYLDTYCFDLYACVLHFCICICSAQLSMFHMERRSRNTLIIIIIIIIIIMIIIALKGAIQDFLQSPLCAPNCLQHVRSSGPGAVVCKPCATQRALFTCNTSCVTWYERTAQLLSLTELK